LKVNWYNKFWIDEHQNYQHVCQPRSTDEIAGLQIRREELKNAAEGRSMCGAASFKQLTTVANQRYGDENEDRRYNFNF
jgi:hypothetical protein